MRGAPPAPGALDPSECQCLLREQELWIGGASLLRHPVHLELPGATSTCRTDDSHSFLEPSLLRSSFPLERRPCFFSAILWGSPSLVLKELPELRLWCQPGGTGDSWMVLSELCRSLYKYLSPSSTGLFSSSFSDSQLGMSQTPGHLPQARGPPGSWMEPGPFVHSVPHSRSHRHPYSQTQ